MIHRLFKITLIMLISALALMSCSNPYNTVRDSENNISQNQQRLTQGQQALTTRAPAAVVNSGYYVSTSPISLDKMPGWLNTRISLRTQNMPLSLLVNRILRDTRASATYESGVQSDLPVSLNYTGTIKGALDLLANKYNYAYDINGTNVNWQAYITKTFNISFMPGSSSYLVGQDAGGGGGSSSSSSGGGGQAGANSGTISTVQGNLGDEQYTNLQGKLSVWQDLTKTLDQLKSPEGKVMVSESTTSVTVQDRPANVAAMSQFIDQLNKMMTKQVSLHITVLELTLSKQYNYGIDWNVVQGILGSQVQVAGATGSAANVSNLLTGGSSGFLSLTLGKADSNAIIQALSTQGKVSVVTEPTVVTMNNQVAEIRITRDTSYLQSVSSTAAVNAGTTTSLTPGIVTDGFSLFLLPKIQNDEVYLQISSTLSNLTALQNVNNKGINNINQNNVNQIDFQSIQVPTLAEKHFNQRTALQSGTTLVITGFQQLRDNTKTVAPLGVTALGGKGVDSQNVQTIVCITPTIIQGRN